MEGLLAAFGIEWQLLFAQGVNFLVLLAGLTYFLYKPVLKLLKDREEFLEKGISEAEESIKIRNEIGSERAQILSKAESDAGSIVSRAEEEGKVKRTELLEATKKRTEALLTDARLQAAELERMAVVKSEKEIVRAAVLAAEKILKES